MASNIIQSDSDIGSFSNEEDSIDMSNMTQLSPRSLKKKRQAEKHPESPTLTPEDPAYLNRLFERAHNIVHGETPKAPRSNKRDLQFSRLKHNMVHLVLDKARYEHSLSILKQQQETGRCPQSLRYKVTPRLKRDEDFNGAFRDLQNQTQSKMLKLLSEQHQRNIAEIKTKLLKLNKELEMLFTEPEALIKAQRDISDSVESSSSKRTKHRVSTVKPKQKAQPLHKPLKFTSPKQSVNIDNIFKRNENKFSKMYTRSPVITLCVNNKSAISQSNIFPLSTNNTQTNNITACDVFATINRGNTVQIHRKNTLSKGRKNRRQNNNRTTRATINAKYIRNLSDKTVSSSQINLVGKGLKFIPTPLTPLSIHTLMRDFKIFQNRMRWSYIYSQAESKDIHPFYTKTHRDAPVVSSPTLETFLDNVRDDISKLHFHRSRDNTPPDEREALKILTSDKEIILKKADKGSTTVLMNKAGKISEGLDLLQNPLHYAILNEPIVESTHAKALNLVSQLYKGYYIDQTTFNYLCLTNKPLRTPEFYTLTKIHKQIPVGRPITSGCGGPTERISQFVDTLLQPVAQAQVSYIRDTTDFINFIESTVVPKEVFLVTMDVTSLYTNIPANEGANFVLQSYLDYYKENLPIPTKHLKELLLLILTENSFRFNGQNYLQLHGVAMGTKVAVSFANIYMANLESKFLAESPVKPLHYKRFIDDVGSLFLCSPQDMRIFDEFINSFHPTIKFTMEISDTEMIFLDTTIFKGPRFETSGLLDVKMYFKPTETFQYTLYSSCHPASCKKGFIKGEALRYLRNNSVKDNFVRDIANFKKRLREREYPPTIVDPILDLVKFENRASALNRTRTLKRNNARTPIMITTYDPRVPSLKPTLMKHWPLIENSHLLSMVFPREPIVAYKREKSLRDSLVRAKL